jgi:hypothetical protein
VDELSSTDRRAAKRMLRDKDWGVDRLVLPLTVRRPSGFITDFFIAEGCPDLIQKAEIAIESAATEARVPPDLLTRPVRPFEPLFPIRMGRDRVAHDLRELRKGGWSATIRVGPGPCFIIVAARMQAEIIFRLPPEYPMSSPGIAVRIDDTIKELKAADLPEAPRWDSTCSIAALAELVWRSLDLAPTQAPSRRTLRQRLGGIVGSIV